MATARPLVQVYDNNGKPVKDKQVPLPAVFSSPLRPDIVRDVFTNMAKNRRQAYAVSRVAGHQTSAESWGTGRAVARIPRVPGGGTHRAGQGAFGNMCRGGRMFAPTKTWRRWHRKINVNQKRYATVSALAASSIPSLVMARGHRIEKVTEIPLVVDNGAVKDLQKTKHASELLYKLGAFDDIIKVKDSRKIRRGKGKSRNRRHVQKRGPLIIYDKKTRLVNAFRNIPGVDLCCVDRLSLLLLAPGGHLGRFVIWVEDAFKKLTNLYGDYDKPAKLKRGYTLPRALMTNADLQRIVNSDEVQSKLRPKKTQKKRFVKKKNPMKNRGFMIKLNPYEKTRLRRLFREQEKRKTEKYKLIEKKRGKEIKAKRKAIKKKRAPYYKQLLSNPAVYEGATAPAATTAQK